MKSQFFRTMGGILSRDPVARRESKWELLNAVARRWDMRMYVPNLDWWKDERHLEVWNQFPESNGDVKDRRFVLYSMALSVSDLEGDTAECGVYAGASSHLLCATHTRGGDDLHHVFDSFAGLSVPETTDAPKSEESEAWSFGDLSVPLERVQANLSGFDFVRFHQGWIPERFDEVADRRFRFVHVDVDLYQPTRDSLDFFWDRLVPGGVLLCDDYSSTRCPGARRAFDEVAVEHGLPGVIEIPSGQGFIIKRSS